MKKLISCIFFILVVGIICIWSSISVNAEVKDGAATKEEKTTTSLVDGVEVSVHRVTCIGEGKINCVGSVSITTTDRTTEIVP